MLDVVYLHNVSGFRPNYSSTCGYYATHGTLVSLFFPGAAAKGLIFDVAAGGGILALSFVLY